MRTANPALNADTFTRFDLSEPVSTSMTMQGTVIKTGGLLVLAAAAAAFTWTQFNASQEAAMPWMIGGLIGGLVVALITAFKQTWSPVTAPIYAVLEGLFLGGISALFESAYPGIAFMAICLTFGTLFVMLTAYQSGLIKATENFKMGIVAATGAIGLVYLVSIGLRFFGMQMPFIHSAGPVGIGFSLFVVAIAALNLVLDFDLIEKGVERGAPKYMEWYAAFGLMVTLVWLYIEILRLLAKLRGRD